MHAPSPVALLLIAIVVLVLFGRGKVSSLMGEVGKGITAFKKGVKEGSDEIQRDLGDTVEVKTVTPAEAQARQDAAAAATIAGTRDVTPPARDTL